MGTQGRQVSTWGKEAQRPKPSVPSLSFPTPVVWDPIALLLTSASFQSPGMQKDSSRSLPHSNKMRSSEERKQNLQRKGRPEKQSTLSLFPLVSTEVPHPWASRARVSAVQSLPLLSLGFSYTTLVSWGNHPCRKSGVTNCSMCPGHKCFRAKPGWLITVTVN